MKKVILYFVLIFLFKQNGNCQNIFVVNKDSITITHLKTGLMWMRLDYAFINKSFLNCWDSAFVFQKKMNKINYAGYSDWVVPSIAEYRTINASKKQRETYAKIFKEIDSVFVWGKGAFSFWAKNEKSKYVASYISFMDGFATSGEKCDKKAGGEWEGIEFGFSVRLVRKIKK